MRFRRKLVQIGTSCLAFVTGALLIALAWKEASNAEVNGYGTQISGRFTREIVSNSDELSLNRDNQPTIKTDPEYKPIAEEAVLDKDTNNSFVLNNEGLCLSLQKDRVSLLIFVESSVDNVQRRQAIRDTWGQLQLQKALNFRLVFLLGFSSTEKSQENVTSENYRYGDLIQTSFTESFRNLTLKSILGLKWASMHCQQSDYVMKADDDIFMHVPNLLTALVEKRRDSDSSSADFLLCHRNRVRTIIRQEMLRSRTIPKSYKKYLVSEREISGTTFPPYCSGLGYVVSLNTAKKLYRMSLVTPYFFIEDAYITGFCREKAGITIRDHPGFTLKPAVGRSQGSCAFQEGRVTSQEMEPEEIRNLWAEINTQGFFCPRVIGYIPINGGS